MSHISLLREYLNRCLSVESKASEKKKKRISASFSKDQIFAPVTEKPNAKEVIKGLILLALDPDDIRFTLDNFIELCTGYDVPIAEEVSDPKESLGDKLPSVASIVVEELSEKELFALKRALFRKELEEMGKGQPFLRSNANSTRLLKHILQQEADRDEDYQKVVQYLKDRFKELKKIKWKGELSNLPLDVVSRLSEMLSDFFEQLRNHFPEAVNKTIGLIHSEFPGVDNTSRAQYCLSYLFFTLVNSHTLVPWVYGEAEPQFVRDLFSEAFYWPTGCMVSGTYKSRAISEEGAKSIGGAFAIGYEFFNNKFCEKPEIDSLSEAALKIESPRTEKAKTVLTYAKKVDGYLNPPNDLPEVRYRSRAASISDHPRFLNKLEEDFFAGNFVAVDTYISRENSRKSSQEVIPLKGESSQDKIVRSGEMEHRQEDQADQDRGLNSKLFTL